MNTTDPPPFPELIDNSMRSSFISCERKFYWSYIRNEVPSPISIHLHAGATFARGLETVRRYYFQNGTDLEFAFRRGLEAAIIHFGSYETSEDEPKSLIRILAALEYYVFEKWCMSQDYLRPLMQHGKASVEFTFALPTDISHPTTGQPLLYGGRCDMIGLYNDALFVVDEKTTTQLGPTWPNKWRLNAQFMGYCWAALNYDYPVIGAIIRGISFLKAGYEGAEAIIQIPQWRIEQWYEQLCHDLLRMRQAWHDGRWSYDFNDTCAAYGGCAYMRLCESPSPEDWLRPYYEQRVWNPLAADERRIAKDHHNALIHN